MEFRGKEIGSLYLLEVHKNAYDRDWLMWINKIKGDEQAKFLIHQVR